MSAQTQHDEEPQRSKPSQWLIVEHVPLPPGRALPAPAELDSRQYAPRAHNGARITDSSEDTFEDLHELSEDNEPREETNRPLAVTVPNSMAQRRASPTTRPLFAELDRLLATPASERGVDQRMVEQLRQLAAEEERQARRKRRRARTFRLLVLAVIVFIVTLTLALVAAHLPALGLRVPHL